MPEPEWVTVAQAAKILGVAERQARRIAERLPDYDRRSEASQGGRPRLMLRVTAIEKAAAAPARSEDAAAPSPDQDRTPAAGSLPAELYRKIINDKDAEIQFLRAQLDQAQQNLAREQTLRALPQPAEAEAGPAAEPNESGDKLRWRWPWSKTPTE